MTQKHSGKRVKKIHLKNFLFIIAVFITLISANQALAQTNLLQNYSFEQNDGWGTKPYFWEMGGSASIKGAIEANAHQGSWAFNIGNDYGPEDAGAYALQVLRDPANPDNLYPITPPGDRVIFTMWMLGETNYTGNALLKIEFFDYDRRNGYIRNPIQTLTGTIHTGKFGYLQEIVTGIIPEGTISVAVVCSSEAMDTGSGFSGVNFDDGTVAIVIEENLLLNPGFEDNTGWGGDATYWEKGGNASYKGTIESNAHQGDWAFNIGNDYGPSNADGYCLQVLRDPANSENPYSVTPGEIITFSMCMMGETSYTGDAFLKIEFYDNVNKLLQTFMSTSHSGKFDYLQETVTGVAPNGAVKAVLVCFSEDMDTGSGFSGVNFDGGCVIIQPPMLPKEVINLNGTWKLEPSETALPTSSRTVSIPGFVDLAVPFIENWREHDYFWYQKTFTLSSSQEHMHAFINMEQSRYGTDVWLNGKHLGRYIGCYTSHKYDATDAINYNGENVLLVKVGQKWTLPPESAVGYDYEETTEETHPDDAFYSTGIWGDVSLILTENPIIERVQIIPHIDTDTAEARITIKNLEAITQNVVISTQVFEKSTGKPASDEIITNYTTSPFKETTIAIDVPIANMKLWSPDNPFLYKLVSKIKLGGAAETDTLTTTFGMREFKIVGSDFYLNGHRIFLKGGNIAFHRFLSDPDRKELPWNEAWIKKVLIDIPKEHNFNFFRIHLGHAYNKWYDIADEYGMMLEDEWMFRASVRYPYRWGPGLGSGSLDQVRREFTKWLYDNWNHPSIIIWDAQNEPHDKGEITKDIIRDVIIPEMKEIDPTRPWEWGINRNFDFKEGAWNPIDFAEDHPYIYSNGPVLNNARFGYARSINDTANSNEPTLLNEFVWFWLYDDGSPTYFMTEVLPRWLGRNSTNQQHLEFQAFLATELCELFRRLDVDGIAPFNYFGRSESGTSDWLTGDLANPVVLPVMSALKNTYAPFGVSIELWDRHFLPQEQRTIDVYVFNDTTQPKSGTLKYKITSQDGLQVLFEGNRAVNVPVTDMVIQPINWILPSTTGTYYFKVELIEDSDVVATSKKIAHVCQRVIPSNLSSAKIMVYDPDNEILNYLTSLDLTAINYNSSQLPQQDIVILGEGALLDTNYNSRIEEITNFVKNGHSLIVIEPSYSIDNTLLNPSFEDNNGEWYGGAAYWEKGGTASNKGTIEASAQQGDWVFSIGNDYGPSNADGYCLQILRDPDNLDNLYPVTPGKEITFNMWMKGEENYTGDALLKIEFYNYDRRNGYINAPLQTFTSASHTGGFDYLRETVTGVAPEGTVSVAVVCLSKGMETGSGFSAVNFDKGNIGANSLLSDLSIVMDTREDINSGGYDSYCFVEELNLYIEEAAASSIQDDNPEFAPNKAIDNNFSTRWSSKSSDPQWICLDLGESVKFNKVVLHWEAACAKSYQIQVSDDKVNWTVVRSITDGNGGVDEIKFDEVSARYVRMYGTERATDWGYSLYEFKVSSPLSSLWNNIDEEHLKMFNGGWGGEMISQCDVELQTNRKNILARSGMRLKYANVVETTWGDGVVVVSRIQLRGRLTEESDPGTDLYSRRIDPVAQQYLLNLLSTYLDTERNWQRINKAMPFLHVKGATASSIEEKTDYTPDKAIDNNLSTRWSSKHSDPQWLCLDLGKSVKFNRVVLRWESAYAKSYEIQVSDDNQDWTNIVYSTAEGNGGIDDIKFEPVTARYVRMYGTERVTQYGYSLYEFEVYSPSTSTISGKVTIQGRTNHQESITFELRNPGQTTPLNTYQVTTASDGSYTLIEIPAGTYDLTAKSLNTLRAKNASISVVEGQATPNINFALLGGDANNDNSVGLSDRFILMKAWDSKIGDPNWDQRADFNADGSIGLSDRFILKSNWDASGAQ